MANIPLHPVLVHLPMALALLMPVVFSLLLAAWWTQRWPRQTWLLAVVLQVALGAGALAALRSGEAEEERVERLVGEAALETHEEAAEVFLWGAGGVLLLALAAALLREERLARNVAAAALLGSLAVAFLGYRTGKFGGQLVYQHGAAAAYVSGAPTPSGAKHDDGEDDDD